MANRPTTEVQKGPPVTALMDNAPGKNRPDTPGPRIDIHYDTSSQSVSQINTGATGNSITPTDALARARPEEAGARTQYDSGRAAAKEATGASTDLGASRDTTGAEIRPDTKPGRPAFVYVLPVVALAAVAGVALIVLSQLKQPKIDPATANSAPPPSAVTLPPVASSTPVAVVSTPPPTVSSPPSASSSAPPTPTKPVHNPNPHNNQNPNNDPAFTPMHN